MASGREALWSLGTEEVPELLMWQAVYGVVLHVASATLLALQSSQAAVRVFIDVKTAVQDAVMVCFIFCASPVVRCYRRGCRRRRSSRRRAHEVVTPTRHALVTTHAEATQESDGSESEGTVWYVATGEPQGV